MIMFVPTRYFEEERQHRTRRRKRSKPRAARMMASELSLRSERDGAGFNLRDPGILAVLAGTAAILSVKVSMVWIALQAIS